MVERMRKKRTVPAPDSLDRMRRPNARRPGATRRGTVNSDAAVVSIRGSRRWEHGHPWIFRSDVPGRPAAEAGIVEATDPAGRRIGWALWSPGSEIALRLLDRDPSGRIDATWWRARIAAAIARRASIAADATAYRLIHAEGDGLPALVCDRYDRWLVVQILSAGLEPYRDEIVGALLAETGADGILARNDVAIRSREGLPREVALLHGDVPREIEVAEYGIRYLADPWTGQKTGGFLDQRENRAFIGGEARGRALDCFSYHGSFALHLARRAEHVVAIDSSAPALARARANVERNGFRNVELIEIDAFEYLRERDRAGDRFDTIVLDPPAFAKNRGVIPAALRGYKEINLRAMRLLAPGGLLYTASCSFHITKPLFLEMLEAAAADSGRRLALRAIRGQPVDHPEVLTIPETGYLKGALIEALD
jgi:23S rRNA (cytosine1962-C5)-methyltransferase